MACNKTDNNVAGKPSSENQRLPSSQNEKRKDADSPIKLVGSRKKQLDTRGSNRKKKFINNLDAFISTDKDDAKSVQRKVSMPSATNGIAGAHSVGNLRSTNGSLRAPTFSANLFSSNDAVFEADGTSRNICSPAPPRIHLHLSSTAKHYILISSSSSECSDTDGFDVPPRTVQFVPAVSKSASLELAMPLADNDFEPVLASNCRHNPVQKSSSVESLESTMLTAPQPYSVEDIDRFSPLPEAYDPLEDYIHEMYDAYPTSDADSSDAADITLVAGPFEAADNASSPSTKQANSGFLDFDTHGLSSSSGQAQTSAATVSTIHDLLNFVHDTGSCNFNVDSDSNISKAPARSSSRASSATRRSASSSDRLQLRLEREQAKQRRGAERAVRQQEAHNVAVARLTNKARQNAYNQLNKWKKTQVAERTVPIIDGRLFSQFNRKNIALLREYCTECRTADNRVPYSVLFMQQNSQFSVIGDTEDEDDNFAESRPTQQRRAITSTSSSEERELEEMLLQLPLDDFVHLAYNNHHKISDNDTARNSDSAPRTPVAYYRWLKAKMPRKCITLFVCGLETYFRQMSTRAAGAASRRRVVPTNSALVISPIMVEETLSILQCFCHVTLHFVEDSGELAEFVGRMTRALEKRPLLVAKQHLYSRCMGTGAAQARIVVRSCDVRTDDALPKLWAQQLAQFPAASGAHAAVVCMRYGGGLPFKLLEYYRSQRQRAFSVESSCEAELHLANEIVQERVRKNGVVVRRRFGAELSRQLYRFYCVDAPDELLKVAAITAADDDDLTVIGTISSQNSEDFEENSNGEDVVLNVPSLTNEGGNQARQLNMAVAASSSRRQAARVPGGTVATLRALAKDFHLDIDDEAFENFHDDAKQPKTRRTRPPGEGAAPKRNFYGALGWRGRGGRAAFSRGRGGSRAGI